ncbi:hypothetical protein Gohar_019750 [Gossypium harknessii]|uniref:Uncharacterized protein n=1 Tax=Gossypium harknessii TaxID=34285 RepID=A0A7J9IDH8_9ROSI|nr:hypothetical protein [Gossypium harknessii]
MGKAPSVPPMGKAPLVPPMGYPPPGYCHIVAAFFSDLNGHGTGYALIAVGTLTKFKWLKDASGILDSKI